MSQAHKLMTEAKWPVISIDWLFGVGKLLDMIILLRMACNLKFWNHPYKF